jgi:hypothetical protein
MEALFVNILYVYTAPLSFSFFVSSDKAKHDDEPSDGQ